MPDIPRVQLPHPLAGTGVENLSLVAEQIVPVLIQGWLRD
jgi:hypothetical protein